MLRSWFQLVERMADPRETLLLAITLESFSRETDWVQLPFIGNMRISSSQAAVTISLIDPITSTIVSSAIGTGTESGSSHGATDVSAIRKAIQSGIYQAVRTYSGG